MQKKREIKEITLKSKLMKLEPKIDLAKQYDEYVNNKNQIPQQEPEPEEQIVYTQKPKEKKKKIIYKEVEEEEEEEEVVYIKKNKPKQQESLDRTYINHLLNNYI